MNYEEYVSKIEAKKEKTSYVFAFQFVGVLATSFFVLSILGVIPEEWNIVSGFRNQSKDVVVESENISDAPVNSNLNKTYTRSGQVSNNQNPSQSDSLSKPTKIVIPKIGVNSNIEHPASQEVSVLDEYLRRGAVYYPGSGYIESGNIFLFGHSTNWAVVQNPAYKTFNDLDKLKEGDSVELYSGGNKYTYKVTSVELKNSSDVLVNLSTTGSQTLTISTCNSFGAKQERWVVEAIRVS